MNVEQELKEIRKHTDALINNLHRPVHGRGAEVENCLWGILDLVSTIEKYAADWEYENGRSKEYAVEGKHVGQGIY